jgi:hypothetical protein
MDLHKSQFRNIQHLYKLGTSVGGGPKLNETSMPQRAGPLRAAEVAQRCVALAQAALALETTLVPTVLMLIVRDGLPRHLRP